jgi:hypothetical protein
MLRAGASGVEKILPTDDQISRIDCMQTKKMLQGKGKSFDR